MTASSRKNAVSRPIDADSHWRRANCGSSKPNQPQQSVAKRLQRDALRLAILPLIQVAALPRLVVRPPEGLTITLPRSVLARHLAFLVPTGPLDFADVSSHRKLSVMCPA